MGYGNGNHYGIAGMPPSIGNFDHGTAGLSWTNGTPSSQQSVVWDGDGGGGWTSTHYLSRPAVITNISVFTGWPNTRMSPGFQVWLSLASGPSFYQLLSFSPNVTRASDSIGGAVPTIFADDTGTIAVGVDAVHFVETGGGVFIYREFDVQGFLIPEPNVLWLLGMGSLLAALSRKPRCCVNHCGQAFGSPEESGAG